MGEAEDVAESAPEPFPNDPTLDQRPKPGVRDPVCGVDVDPAGAAASSEYRGVPYYFCTLTCRAMFEANPTRYAG